jgi:hypothetical protein
MATIINSSTNPQGLIQTSDGTAVLKIQTDDLDALTIDANQNLTVNNDLSVAGDTSITGNTTIGGTANITGDVAITGTLNVTGTTTISDLDFDNPVFSGNVTVQSQGDVRFADSDSSNFVALQAPTTVASNVTLTLPNALAPTNGDCLVSDTSGNITYAKRATTGKAIAMSIVFG